jgi:group II intron reverse transcriptase/maturase
MRKTPLSVDKNSAFDNVQHDILMKLLTNRIADDRLLDLIDCFLKAGIMEGQLFKRNDAGVPQGGICSPLLANVYLHQLDLYWWNNYGNLHRKVKERRRTEHLGNCSLIRYADDWLLLTNGSRQEAHRLRDEFQSFLAVELKLELSVEKTHITHVNDGFDFLGFHIRRYVSGNDRPKLFVKPSVKNQTRLKDKVREMTERKRFQDSPLLKFSALNAVLRGWIAYYRHCNTKEVAKDLDFWVNERLFLWLQKRHRLPPHRIIELYKKRQNETRDNWGIQDGEKILYLYCMNDQALTKYKSRNLPNPYLVADHVSSIQIPELAIPEYVWLGNAQNNEVWREIKAEVEAERGEQCEICGKRVLLDLHHLKARRYGGQDTKENAQLLCEDCHAKTPTYGDHSRLQ